MKAYLFSFQMMYKSQFHKTVPYDWFVVQGYICVPKVLKVWNDMRVSN